MPVVSKQPDTMAYACNGNGNSTWVFATTHTQAAKIADALTRDVHYTVDEKQKSVLLTEDG